VTDLRDIIMRQLDRSGNTLMLALEPVSDEEFYAENLNGFSAAWTVGHLACVADLFSYWLDDEPLLFDPGFHKVFNDTDVNDGEGSRTVDRVRYPKKLLLKLFQQAMVKALRVLKEFDLILWDGPAPPGVPVSLGTSGAVWEHLGVHVYWHCGELAGSMPRFFDTYTLNILPHYFYLPQEKTCRTRTLTGNGNIRIAG
jgi:hypothetical protein